MRKHSKLTARSIAALSKKLGRHADGGGLYLVVRPSGPTWGFRYMIDGVARMQGLGPLHTVNLQEARNRARQQRQLLIDGKDPIEVKREAATAARVEQLRTVTFAEACDRFMRTDKIEALKSDVHRKQWQSTLARAGEAIGDLPLNSIDSALVLKALERFEGTSETLHRVRGRIERVFGWAKACNLYDHDNPASRDVLKDVLPAKRKVQHHPSLPYQAAPALMARLRDNDSMSARALEFLILTASRTKEIIEAQWSEIDFDAAAWNIPAAHMKSKEDHRVPLSVRAVEILRSLDRHGEHVFGNGRPISNQTMSELIKPWNLPSATPGRNATVHGFRSTFRTWADERTAYDFHTKETALAHVTHQSKVEAAYNRSDAFDKRRRLMSEWTRYLEAPATEATVHKIGTARSA
jgi:integrase